MYSLILYIYIDICVILLKSCCFKGCQANPAFSKLKGSYLIQPKEIRPREPTKKSGQMVL